MTYEELIENAWHSGQLAPAHPLYPFEDRLLSALIGQVGERAKHDQEHRDMLTHWNIPFEDEVETELSLLDGKHNRVWHILLHFRYWEEKKINVNILNEFKTIYPEINLGEVPLPRVKGD